MGDKYLDAVIDLTAAAFACKRSENSIADKFTAQEKKDCAALIQAFDKKRRDVAEKNLYAAAKAFVAAYEARFDDSDIC